MKWIEKILGISELKEELRLAKAALAQTEAEKTKEKVLSPKEIATAAGEPYIEIISMEVNSDNPTLGSFELDWNEPFVKKLRAMGYPGKTDEIVVDLWFQDVCRNILLETYEQEQANRGPATDNIRYINRKDIGDGKTEVS